MFFVLLEHNSGYTFGVSGPFSKLATAEEACVASLRSGTKSAKIIRKSQLNNLDSVLPYQASAALAQMARIQTSTKKSENAKPTI